MRSAMQNTTIYICLPRDNIQMFLCQEQLIDEHWFSLSASTQYIDPKSQSLLILSWTQGIQQLQNVTKRTWLILI